MWTDALDLRIEIDDATDEFCHFQAGEMGTQAAMWPGPESEVVSAAEPSGVGQCYVVAVAEVDCADVAG